MSKETREEEVSASKSTSLRRYLIGLSPQYWAYVPMLICDLLHLQLVDGVLCLPIVTCSNSSQPSSCSTTTTTSIHIPVSKCEIQGVITNIQRQSKGVLLYLIDDGTGFIDCLDYDTNSETDYYSIPSLVAVHPSEARYYAVGDAVSIRGKIRVVGFSNTNNNSNNIDMEVHVSCMTKLTPSNYPHGLHWLTSIRVTTTTTTSRPKSGDELFQSLGPDICNPVLLHDTNEHYFGKACTCDNLPQKDSLLYCHCHAKPEALDPMFTFRDALLAILIEMEQQQCTATTVQTLYFFYKDIVANATLVNIAAQTLFTSTPTTKVHQHRLFVNTFRALREDGIVFLLDEDTDEYMLLSKNRVLLPYLQDNSKNKQRPNYLRHVPNSRLKHLSQAMKSDKNNNNNSAFK